MSALCTSLCYTFLCRPDNVIAFFFVQSAHRRLLNSAPFPLMLKVERCQYIVQYKRWATFSHNAPTKHLYGECKMANVYKNPYVNDKLSTEHLYLISRFYLTSLK